MHKQIKVCVFLAIVCIHAETQHVPFMDKWRPIYKSRLALRDYSELFVMSSLTNKTVGPGEVAHIYNPSTGEVKARGENQIEVTKY